MKKQGYACDVCGAERAEANHWFVLVDSRKANGSISIWPFSVGKDYADAEHLCGQACVQKRVDAYLVAL